MNEKQKIKPLGRPGFTMFNNYILDHFMPSLSANGWKVLCVAIRQTIGWTDDEAKSGRKEKDRIAYSQFMASTGIKSSATLRKALQENLDKGYLLREPSQDHSQMFDYRLNMDYEIEVDTALENEVVDRRTTASENEAVRQTTTLDSKEEGEETALESKDTKEKDSKKTTIEKKEGEPSSKTIANSKLTTFQQGDDYYDVAQKCAQSPNFSTPAHAGGADAAAGAALAAMYLAIGSQPPREGTRSWVDSCGKVGQVLRDRGMSDPEQARRAGRLFGEANRETLQFVNPHQSTFPEAFGVYVGKVMSQPTPQRPPLPADYQPVYADEPAPLPTPDNGDDRVGHAVKDILAGQMQGHTFDQYVAPATFAVEDGHLVVTAPDEDGRAWLASRLEQTIKRALAGFRDAPKRVRFEVQQ